MIHSSNLRVSVIITTHNRANLLPRAVHSILVQTLTEYEIIIVDDASTDHTQKVIAAFNDSRIRSFRHETNRGHSAALNTGIDQAKGEYIAFLDDDDELTPTSLADRLAVFELVSPHVALVYGYKNVLNDSSGELKAGRRLVLNGAEAFEFTLTGMNIAPTSTLLVQTFAANDVGGFDERLVAGNDSYFISSISQKYQIAALPKVTTIYHIAHGSARVTDWTADQGISLDTFFDLHIERFSAELERRPRLFASLLLRKAVNSMEIRNVRNSIVASLHAFKRHPLNLGNIRHILRLIKVFVFYVTPVSHYRSQAQLIQRALGLRRE